MTQYLQDMYLAARWLPGRMRLVGVLGVAHAAPLRAALLRQGAVHLGSVEIVDTDL